MTVHVAKSYGVGDAGLNFNAALYESRQNTAAVWDLRPATSEVPHPDAVKQRLMTNDGHESVIGGEDGRKLVSDADLSPNGKYRSIVKILTHHEFQPPGQYCHGTGWLISDDIFVTAGHCSYDWSAHKYGRAVEVKAYIGYKGQGSVNSANVQFRHVKRIATTGGWVTTAGLRPFDVSFMQLATPFSGVKPFKFAETPASGNFNLGVVGYPGDLKENGEAGARMYEMFLPTKFNLSEEKDRMLQYEIDTYGGNSGSPVFVGNTSGVSIGVHVYGGSINSASVIGRFGNAFTDFIQVFKMGPLPNEGVNLVPVGRGPAIPPLESVVKPEMAGQFTRAGSTGVNVAGGTAFNSRGFQQERVVRRTSISLGSQMSPHSNDKVLMDVLHRAHELTQHRTGSNPHALGSVGSPAAALAGISLNTAVSAQLKKRSGGMESFGAGEVGEGAVQRAILAEATLAAIEAHPLPHHVEEAFFDDIKSFVVSALPTVKKIGGKVMGVATESALKLALDEIQKHNKRGAGGTESFDDLQPAAPIRLPTVNTIPGDRRSEAVLAAMAGGQHESFGGDTEGLFGIISTGVRIGSQLLGGLFGGHESISDEESWWEDGFKIAGKIGRGVLGGFLGESLETGSGSADPQLSQALAQRALVAEAALQAVLKTPPESLEEGFFDFVRSGVKSISSAVSKYAPTVLNGVKNIALTAIQQQLAGPTAGAHESFEGGTMGSLPAFQPTSGGGDFGPTSRLQALRGDQPKLGTY